MMQTRRRTCLALSCLVALLLASTVTADEFVFSVQGEARYDDNILRTTDDLESDVLLIPEASFLFRKPEGPLRYRLEWRPFYEAYANNDAFNNWSQRATAEVNYFANSATELYLRDTFFQGESADRDLTDPVAGDITQTLRTARLENRIEAGLRQSFSQGFNLNASLGYFFVDFDEDTQRDASTFDASMQFYKALSPRTQVGFSLSAAQQNFEEFRGIPSSWTRFYNIGLYLSHQFTPQLSFNFNAGPAYIENQEQELSADLYGQESNVLPAGRIPGTDSFLPYQYDRCGVSGGYTLFPLCSELTTIYDPSFPDDRYSIDQGIINSFGTTPYLVQGDIPTQSNTSQTYFGTVSLRQQWPLSDLALGFTRRESSTAGIGTSTVNSRLNLTYNWQFWRNWSLRAFVEGSLFESSGESLVPVRTVEARNVPGPGFDFEPQLAAFDGRYIYVKSNSLQDFVQYTGQLRIDYRMSRQLLFWGAGTFTDQQDNSAFNTRRDFDRLYLSLGLRYTFDAIHY